jgi:N-acetylglucosamine-6-phosphate deacetylase
MIQCSDDSISMRFIDLQVNGYGGVDFNQDDLSADALRRACEMLRQHNVESILATIITEKLDTMCLRLTNLARLREADPLARQIIAGFHVEGPFINETTGYVGAHPKDAVLPADVETMKRLLDAANGLTRMVTLAPERDANFAVTRMLAKQNVRISAGHCDPTLDQLRGAIDAGLSMFTHLGNGCPALMHRHDNIIQRALSVAEKLLIGFIADGTHVPMFALANFLKVAGIENCYVVTDAIAPAGLGPGRYTLGRWDLLIEEDMVARSPDRSHFVGSAITMPQTWENLTKKLGLTDQDARRLVYDNPREVTAMPT